MDSLNQTTHNPDVLSCLANLSNDEVFTPPKLANDVLDLLPSNIWSNPSITFLDPCCKTGVFLREITIRLIEGLKDEIPDLQERVNHILTKQVFGIAITELTALMTRRTLYCSKNANGKYSICTEFGNNGGNIYYNPKVNHQWKNGKCILCGASQELWQRDDKLESYAYAFIHKPIKELFNVKFDVIIGNPPYQLDNGGGSDIPLYHKFVEEAKKLNPKYITMIIPARWLIGGKRELKLFRNQMLNDSRIKYLYDFKSSRDCFSGVDIEGGVCYFLWDINFEGMCTITTNDNGIIEVSKRRLLEVGMDTFIRNNLSINIYKKVSLKHENTFDTLVSSQTPFGLLTNFNNFKNENFKGALKLYKRNGYAFVDPKYLTKNIAWVDNHKILISKAYGMGKTSPYQVINKPFYSAPNECCTQTYLVITPFLSEKEAYNAITYIKTKFFRFMVLLKKIGQDNGPDTFSLVPIQDFSKPWSDEQLYKKYGLTEEEIDYIESNIRSMDSKEE